MSGEPSRRIIDVDVTDIDTSGDGIALAGPTRLSVPFTIPGERVRLRLESGRNGRMHATLLEVVRASPHRVPARCVHFGTRTAALTDACGGCVWQHIAYPEQLRLKQALVDRLVRQAVADAPPARDTLPATRLDEPWGFRNKVHFVFASPGGRRCVDGPLIMGHYARGSRRVIPVRECPVHDERGNAFAFSARDVFAAAGVSPAGTGGGVLRSISVRAGYHTSEIMATIVVARDADRRLRSATRRLMDQNPPTSMQLNVHERDDPYVFGTRTRRLRGSERLREQIAGASLLTSPTAFFQTHARAAEILVGLVSAAVPPGAPVLDLYAGGGLFAIPLAVGGHPVVAIDENRHAIADGEAALRLNPAARDRCRFVARPVEAAVRTLRQADAVVLDPPREGCSAPLLRDVFGRLLPSVAAYVSCNPESLATDLKIICTRGYRIRSLQPVDMFPHTAHVETVAILERAVSRTSRPPHRERRR